MATLKPFAALRPKPELAAQICELPYDVMSSEEARVMAEGKPLSFLHVSKPEIDLPAGTDLYSSEVYAKGRANFASLIALGALKQDEKPNFYLYRQIMGGHTQVGLVAAASCEEYLANIIKKHELTRPDKEDDRVRHIEALNSQTGPVFLTYRAAAAFDAFVAKKIAGVPAVDFTGKDGVRHTSWTISSADEIKFVETQFAQIPFLYIADGHHRSAAAGRVFKTRHGAGHSGQFLAVIFPHNQMQILPYNRVLKDLNGLMPDALLQKLARVFKIKPSSSPKPTRKHELALFIFGIDDPRTSKKINFVGGIRGTAELEKLVNSGEYACAFSMFPTSIEDLMSIADAGGIMPPKSTWFEPKLRDAMFCHMI